MPATRLRISSPAWSRLIHPIIRNEIEDPFVEGDHRFHLFVLNGLPEFSHGFGFDFPVEILFPKYLLNIFRVIGWKGIVAVEDEFEWTGVFHIEANVPQFLRGAIFFGDGQPAGIFHDWPEKAFLPFGSSRKEHTLLNGDNATSADLATDHLA